MSSIPEDVNVDKDVELADPDAKVRENAVDRSATKAEAAVALLVYGASYTEIKNRLGYSSAHRARIACERALAASADSEEDRDKMRLLIGKRLNRLLASHMAKAVDPKEPAQLAYSARVLAILDRQAKLYGADAPTQLQISATDSVIEEMVAVLSPTASSDLEQVEYDITQADEDIEDAEVIE